MALSSDLFTIRGVSVFDDSAPQLSEVHIHRKSGRIDSIITDPNNFSQKADFILEDGQYLFPGILDIHIHAREDATGKHNHKETYETALNAAINGGVVCVCAMPNTPEPPVSETHYLWHRKKIASLNHPVECLNYIGVGTNTNPLKNRKLFYKVYAGPSVGELFFRSPEELDLTLSRYEGQNISFHVEDFDVLQQNAHRENHALRRPPECVLVALEYLTEMIEKYSLRAKLCHWSVGRESLNRIEAHRNRMEKLNLGYNTTVEVSPMHLLFDAEKLEKSPELWPWVQMNPSIQSAEDRLDLIAALKDGVIDYLATDHAPHTLQEKFSRFACWKDTYPGCENEEIYQKLLQDDLALCRKICLEDGVSGAPWLDTYGLVLGELKEKHGFRMQDLARISALNPGNFVNPYREDVSGSGYGKIAPGYMAAFSILDFSAPFRVIREKLRTKSRWSPLEGRVFPNSIRGILVKDQFFPSSQN